MVHNLHNYAAAYVDYENTSNANKNSEKYSLRQRQRSRKSIIQQENLNKTIKVHLSNTTYTHGQNEARNINRSNTILTTINKTKTKAAPLSKYRRKTANARERSRMREINSAFECLRQCVPSTIAEEDVGCANEKLTKITTLRLAMKYIKKLSEALADPNTNVDFLLDNKSIHFYDDQDPSKSKMNSCLPPKENKNNNSSNAVVQSIKNKTQPKRLPKTSLHNDTKSTVKSSSTKKHYIFSNLKRTTFDFDQHNFESDGESLHLSEACLSPINENSDDLTNELIKSEKICNDRLINQNINLNSYEQKSPNRSPFEISLCLLDSTHASVDFVTDQESSLLCNSPFSTLDTFNSISDLLQHDFVEQSSFDLFLT